MSASADLLHGNMRVRAAKLAYEREGHFEVRHAIFVREQQLFQNTDVDELDTQPSTIHLVGESDGRIVGAVRIYPIDGPDRWQGDRLAVHREHRTSHLGVHLVQLAVTTAAALGGTVMEAHVQVSNVRFFEYLGWHANGPTEIYVGSPHQPMRFDLASIAQ